MFEARPPSANSGVGGARGSFGLGIVVPARAPIFAIEVVSLGHELGTDLA
jgi:hypothetical protein